MTAEERHDRRPILPPEVFAELRSHLALPVLVVGIGGGLIGAIYLGAVDLLRKLVGPGGHTAVVQTAILAATGLVVVLGTRWLGPSGNVELLVDNIHISGGSDDVRALRSLLPTSIACIAAGGPLGPEAPLVQTSGTFGGWLSSKRHLDADDMRILTITGMAAGFAVLFGAPLGAALFALEVLHSRGLQYYEALVPSLIGALAGYAMYIGLTGMGLEPLWRLPDVGALHASDLGWGLACGVIGAAGAAAFTFLAALGRRLAQLAPAPLLPVLGGVLLGLIFAWSPFALTNGEGQVELIAGGAMTASALVIAIVAKFSATIVAVATRWKGGFIIPLFFMGMAGGQLLHLAVPSSNVTVLMAALAVALCVGVTKTPLGSTLSVTQMAGLPLLPMTLVAALAALLLTSGSTMIATQRETVPAAGGHVTPAATIVSDHEYETLADFRYALRRFLRFSEEAARAVGLPPNQHQLLLAIRGWRGRRAPSISDAAERLQLRHHSTVELVQRAVAAGLVVTLPDPTDQRRQLLHLTPTGEVKLTALSILHRQELMRFRRQMAALADLLD